MQKEKEIKKFYKTSLTRENFIKILGYEKALIYSKNNEIFINSLKIKDENINIINEKEFMKYHSDKKNSIVKNVTELFLTEEKKYYRSIKFRNISEKLDIFQLFMDYEVYINFEKKENLIAILNNSYENERKKYEKNLPFEYEKIKITLDELNNIEFNQKLIFDLKIVLESDSIENLNEKTEELRKKMYDEYGIYSYIETHSKNFYNFSSVKNGMSMMIDSNNNCKLLSFSQIGKSKQIKSSQSILPYEKILSNGIVKIEKNKYCEIYSLENINYIFAREKEREELTSKYREIINAFSKDVEVQFLINNEVIDIKQKQKEMLCKTDEGYIGNYNEYLRKNIDIAEKNAPERHIYFIVKTFSKDDKEAEEKIHRVTLIMKNLFKIIGSGMTELSIEEKVKLFYYYYNFDYSQFSKNRNIVIPENFEQEDFISPSSIKVFPKYLQVGNVFKKSIKLSSYPNFLKDTFIFDVVNLPFEVCLSMHIKTDDISQNIELIRKQTLKIERNIIEKQEARKKGKNGYISHETQRSYQDALKLKDYVEKEDERLYDVSIYITVQAENKKELDKRYETLVGTIKRHMFRVDDLFFEQIEGIKATFPVAQDFGEKKTIRTSNLVCLTPFATQEVYQPTGIYYGRSKSENLLVVDKKKLMNSSSWFLGVPGSGKSFMAKKEMVSVNYRYPNDDILVVDPENEYGGMLKAMGGEVIDISVKTKTFLNPLHITDNLERLLDQFGDESPVLMKKESIMGFIESLLNRPLVNVEKTLIDRIVDKLYKDYIEKIEYLNYPEKILLRLEQQLKLKDEITDEFIYSGKAREEIEERLSEYRKDNVTKENTKCPNLKDLYTKLIEIDTSIDASELALELEYHVLGTINIFSHDSNVNTDNRIVCYNIRDVKKELKGSALILVCEAMWERIVKNKKLGKNTWIYIDEIYLLFEHEKSADFLMEFYKRTRKYGGLPCGLTQNISDLLRNDKAKSMLSNSEFKVILNQSASDREELATLFELSPVQIEQIKNSASGEGLLMAGKNVIPFSDKFPIENPLYKMMNTRLETTNEF